MQFMKRSMTSPYTPLGSLIASHQLQAGISDKELAQALDYNHVTVVTLIKSGAMRLPFMKVIVLAEALRADARVVMRLTMDEAIPGLYELVEGLMGQPC